MINLALSLNTAAQFDHAPVMPQVNSRGIKYDVNSYQTASTGWHKAPQGIGGTKQTSLP